MLLVSRQNIAPQRKAKKGQRVIGFTSSGDIILVTSSRTLVCSFNVGGLFVYGVAGVMRTGVEDLPEYIVQLDCCQDRIFSTNS